MTMWNIGIIARGEVRLQYFRGPNNEFGFAPMGLGEKAIEYDFEEAKDIVEKHAKPDAIWFITPAQ